MRTFYFIILTFLIGCNSNDVTISESQENNVAEHIDTISEKKIDPAFLIHQTIDTILLGDMNKDGRVDTAIIYSPFFSYYTPDDSESGDCDDDSCLTTIKFNFTKTNLYHSMALGFQVLFPVEDLNSDGIKEIGFIPNWFQSCWQGLFVYSFINMEWKKIGSGSVYACSDEDFSKRVKKIKSGEFVINSMKWSDDGGELVDTNLIFKIGNNR